jgi:hypothetical protein
MFLEQMDNFSNDFKSLFIIIENTIKKRETIILKINSLKTQYNELLKANNKKLFLLCLDSFFYQYKYFSMELEQIENSRKLVINRMYCEYYKLYKNILNYIEETKIDYEREKEKIKTFPNYKDLEPLFEYSFDDINIVFDNIIILLNIINNHFTNNMLIINNYNQQFKIGFTIFNFTNTMQNDNLNIENQIKLFMNFLSFFLYSQKKYNEQIYSRFDKLYNNIDDILLSQDIIYPILKPISLSINSLVNLDLSENCLIFFDESKNNTIDLSDNVSSIF